MTSAARSRAGSPAVLIERLDHPEGVTVDRRGFIFASGEGGQVYRIGPDARSATVVAMLAGRVLGLCADGRGRLYCCDAEAAAVKRVDPDSGTVEELSDGLPRRRMVKPNWAVFADDGGLFVTDSGHLDTADGCIFRIGPDGATDVWCESTVNYPNGAALSADGHTLFVAESFTRPAIAAIPIDAHGTAGRREVLIELPGHVPDGIALDSRGDVYVCCYRPDRVLRIDGSGRAEVVAEDPRGVTLAAPTNAVFAGPEMSTLVIANLGRQHLTSLDLGVAGLPLRYPQP